MTAKEVARVNAVKVNGLWVSRTLIEKQSG